MSDDTIIDVQAREIPDERLSTGQQKIKGYRDLSPAEIELMNKIKTTALVVGELVEALAKIESAKINHGSTPEQMDSAGEALRWVSVGKTHLQQGFMALSRAVAKPEGF